MKMVGLGIRNFASLRNKKLGQTSGNSANCRSRPRYSPATYWAVAAREAGATLGGQAFSPIFDAAGGDVVPQAEVDDISKFVGHMQSFGSRPEVKEALKDYMDLVDGGHREIYDLPDRLRPRQGLEG